MLKTHQSFPHVKLLLIHLFLGSHLRLQCHLLSVFRKTYRSIIIVVEIFELGHIFLGQTRIIGEIVLDIMVEFCSANSIITVYIRLFEFIIITLKGVQLGLLFHIPGMCLKLLGEVGKLGILSLQLIHVIVILSVQRFLLFLVLFIQLCLCSVRVELSSCKPTQCTSNHHFTHTASSTFNLLLLLISVILIHRILSIITISFTIVTIVTVFLTDGRLARDLSGEHHA
mmetsp:Transcript_5298/g.7762  ORF Transcript_5298/g.7762 Transcript_5298/m.7762 type:complete len:227 (+) Transcript_5298:78-758(+)